MKRFIGDIHAPLMALHYQIAPSLSWAINRQLPHKRLRLPILVLLSRLLCGNCYLHEDRPDRAVLLWEKILTVSTRTRNALLRGPRLVQAICYGRKVYRRTLP